MAPIIGYDALMGDLCALIVATMRLMVHMWLVMRYWATKCVIDVLCAVYERVSGCYMLISPMLCDFG